MEVVTEQLLHAERKQKEKASVDCSGEKAMALKFKGRGPRCHYSKKMGHIQKNCWERIKAKRKAEQDGPVKRDAVGLVTSHCTWCE